MQLISHLTRSPLALLVLVGVMAIALLIPPLRLPIGANYWDLYTYVDTVYRMRLGQVPHVDFFVPVGSLGYALFDLVSRIFPKAHPLLAIHFSLLILTLPIMAVVANEACKRSQGVALALVIGFALFALVPMNIIELYPSPGVDAYGNYNRHGALLLMVLAAVLLFVDNRRVAAWLTVVLLAALFMIKITGFLVGLVIVIHAGIAGRLSLRGAIEACFPVALILGLLEWRFALITAYIEDIAELARMNTGYLLPRVLTVLSLKFNVIAPALILISALIWRDRAAIMASIARPSLLSLRSLANRDAAWLISLLAAGAVYETQNTGSQEFILLWPALVRLFRKLPVKLPALWRRQDMLLLLLIAATALPTPVILLHRTARVVASMPTYATVEAPLMGPFGFVSAKPDVLRHSRGMLAHYAMARTSYEQLAKRGILPSYILFSEMDFQVSWMISVQEAAEALLAYEKLNNKRFERIVTLDFVDPLPVMLGRTPLLDMSIGNDPTRTLMKLNPRATAEIRRSDAILLPKCPPTDARNAIADAYSFALEGRRVVALTPCFTMMVRD
jgi:hypothetical protein